MSLMALSELKVNEKGVIESFEGDHVLTQRLQEMGLVKGTTVLIKRFAPLGDPIEIIVRGYSLSIRRDDARHILLQAPE